MNGFFALRSSRDMFAKLEREYRRLLNDPGIDNVFNFYVTAYHVSDYLKNDPRVSKGKVQRLFRETDMQTCADLCNKGKHMILSENKFANRRDPVAEDTSGAIGCMGFNDAAINGTPAWVIYYPDDPESVEILPLADRVMSRLEAFFSVNNL